MKIASPRRAQQVRLPRRRVRWRAPTVVMHEPMRCAHCGDVIGVYEPLVLLTGGEPRTTSAAAEPQIGDEPGVLFHRACYAQSPAASARHSDSV